MFNLVVQNWRFTGFTTYSLSERDYSINSGNVKRFNAPIGPFDFEFIDLRRCTQTEVQDHVVLRTKYRTAYNVLSLSHRACGQKNRGADRIAWTLLHVAHQSQAQPVCTRRCDIPQQDRLRIEIIDHEIESAIAIEISDRETSCGPGIR